MAAQVDTSHFETSACVQAERADHGFSSRHVPLRDVGVRARVPSVLTMASVAETSHFVRACVLSVLAMTVLVDMSKFEMSACVCAAHADHDCISRHVPLRDAIVRVC